MRVRAACCSIREQTDSLHAFKVGYITNQGAPWIHRWSRHPSLSVSFVATVIATKANDFLAYSVLPSSTMAYTMEKILASMLACYLLPQYPDCISCQANSHRVFVTNGDPIVGSPSSSPVDSSSNSGNLTGIVSIIDSELLVP